VFQLAVREPGRPAAWVPVGRFPFVIGRSADASLSLAVPGVWDRHLELVMDRKEGLVAVAAPDALVRHAGHLIERHRVRMGDEFEVGPVVVQVALTAPARRSLRSWEVLLWMVLGVMLAAQAAAALWLLWVA
jgi:hypothetical protein